MFKYRYNLIWLTTLESLGPNLWIPLEKCKKEDLTETVCVPAISSSEQSYNPKPEYSWCQKCYPITIFKKTERQSETYYCELNWHAIWTRIRSRLNLDTHIGGFLFILPSYRNGSNVQLNTFVVIWLSFSSVLDEIEIEDLQYGLDT